MLPSGAVSPDACNPASHLTLVVRYLFLGKDCNANEILDDCEGSDCNENGVLDSCDIAAGTTVPARLQETHGLVLPNRDLTRKCKLVAISYQDCEAFAIRIWSYEGKSDWAGRDMPVIAREHQTAGDEAIRILGRRWIASRSLSSGRTKRGPVGWQ